MKEMLEVNAVERWNVRGKWVDYKKTLREKFAKKYPDYEISIKKMAGNNSGVGLIDYAVEGTLKEAL